MEVVLQERTPEVVEESVRRSSRKALAAKRTLYCPDHSPAGPPKKKRVRDTAETRRNHCVFPFCFFVKYAGVLSVGNYNTGRRKRTG